MFYINDLGSYHPSLLVRWTISAYNCYKCGCVCSKCPTPEYAELKPKCHMKPYVLELVKKFGVPEECKIFDTKTLFTSTEATPTDGISRKRTK